ncbi:NAD(P)H-dependent oxidoreductase [Maribellus comscasis]|uniref:NAD(P)H-dependent oxidoreductase n=1 Tax=Maribellus comscasis TaxID=2681766 RepID=A0A6I6JWK7_9BACT|nr:NAD(P)H-dependent oxidoreductase [Maribellus comscasis]QGY45719.1 NAD(P)H-dependent oxidoreductase [Maribellus comscasis]
MELLKNLEWRYATKKFDPNRKVSQTNLEKIKRAIQLSVSSYGLQLYKVLIIENKNIREQLKPVSWNQNQITDASHLFVFCNYTKINDDDIDDFIRLTSQTRNIEMAKLEGYGEFIKMKLAEKSEAEQTNWLERQPYLAVSNLLIACSELEIDACPMEGFEPDKYNEILGLTEKGLNTCVIATIGYRDDSDRSQDLPKVRKSTDLLFEEIEQKVPESLVSS